MAQKFKLGQFQLVCIFGKQGIFEKFKIFGGGVSQKIVGKRGIFEKFQFFGGGVRFKNVENKGFRKKKFFGGQVQVNKTWKTRDF